MATLKQCDFVVVLGACSDSCNKNYFPSLCSEHGSNPYSADHMGRYVALTGNLWWK